MAKAAAVDDASDANEDLDPAFTACVTLAEFSASSAKYPAALDGVDPAVYTGNRCNPSYNTGLENTALCRSLT